MQQLNISRARSKDMLIDSKVDQENHQQMLKQYHENDRTQLGIKQEQFNKNIADVRRLCSDTEEFFRGVDTKIIKDGKR
jgi:hypothetical protein